MSDKRTILSSILLYISLIKDTTNAETTKSRGRGTRITSPSLTFLELVQFISRSIMTSATTILSITPSTGPCPISKTGRNSLPTPLRGKTRSVSQGTSITTLKLTRTPPTKSNGNMVRVVLDTQIAPISCRVFRIRGSDTVGERNRRTTPCLRPPIVF